MGVAKPLARNVHAGVHTTGVMLELLIILLEGWGFISVCVRRFRDFQSRGFTAYSVGLLIGAVLLLTIHIAHGRPLGGTLILCLGLLIAL
jgi:uncharacterized membrane protein YhaH (DUF805 family)